MGQQAHVCLARWQHAARGCERRAEPLQASRDESTQSVRYLRHRTRYTLKCSKRYDATLLTIPVFLERHTWRIETCLHLVVISVAGHGSPGHVLLQCSPARAGVWRIYEGAHAGAGVHLRWVSAPRPASLGILAAPARPLAGLKLLPAPSKCIAVYVDIGTCRHRGLLCSPPPQAGMRIGILVWGVADNEGRLRWPPIGVVTSGVSGAASDRSSGWP